MGRQRVPEQPREQHAEEAAFVASILAGTLIVPNPAEAIAAVLLAVAPASLLVIPETAASVAFGVASLVVQTPGRSARPVRGGPASQGQFLRESAYKGFYALSALKRVAVAEDRTKALQRERRFFGQQLEASRQRMAGAALNDAATERWGPVLSWNHGPEGPNDRLRHVAADGQNFDVRNPPRETDGLPGTLPACKCYPGPPIPGARMLV